MIMNTIICVRSTFIVDPRRQHNMVLFLQRSGKKLINFNSEKQRAKNNRARLRP